VSEPKVSVPKPAEPRVAAPKATEPKVAAPKVVGPKAALPKVTPTKVAGAAPAQAVPRSVAGGPVSAGRPGRGAPVSRPRFTLADRRRKVPSRKKELVIVGVLAIVVIVLLVLFVRGW
jgi:hypothetical protein